MYTPPAFREDDPAVLRAIIGAAGLATLVTATAEGLIGTPLPLFLDPDRGRRVLSGHVARANPQWRLAPVGEALAIFAGPDAYVTPAWYASKREHGWVVPTWNRRGPCLWPGRVLRGRGAPSRRGHAPHRAPRGAPGGAVGGVRRAGGLHRRAAPRDRRRPPADRADREQRSSARTGRRRTAPASPRARGERSAGGPGGRGAHPRRTGAR